MDSRCAVGFVVCWLLAAVVAPMPYFGTFAPPDFFLVALLMLGIERGASTGQFAGFIVGAVVDLLSSGRIGPTAAAYTVVGYLGGRAGLRFTHSRFVTLFLCVIWSVSVAEVTAYAISRIGRIPMHLNFADLVLRTISSLLVTPFMYFIRNPLGLGHRGK